MLRDALELYKSRSGSYPAQGKASLVIGMGHLTGPMRSTRLRLNTCAPSRAIRNCSRN